MSIGNAVTLIEMIDGLAKHFKGSIGVLGINIIDTDGRSIMGVVSKLWV